MMQKLGKAMGGSGFDLGALGMPGMPGIPGTVGEEGEEEEQEDEEEDNLHAAASAGARVAVVAGPYRAW
eukprot:355593-Chlamydomonas_euryale.AAC.6